MKNNGKADATIKYVGQRLKTLEKYTDLKNPEKVKQFIANRNIKNSSKNSYLFAYLQYCEFYKIEWNMVKYHRNDKMPRIPTTEQLNMLISHSGRVMSVKLTLSKETGLRPVEVCNLKVKDIDLTHKTVYPTTAKHGTSRVLKISTSLNAMLKTYITAQNLNPNDNLFKGDSANYGKHFRVHRNQLAEKLKRPELRTIKLHDFRHYFATRLYTKTKDILHVMQQMGHKNIMNTLKYTQLAKVNEEEEYTCRATTDDKEAHELIEVGFEYVTTTPTGLMLFRKRK
jgi:integrase